jgi:hypothetical protein
VQCGTVTTSIGAYYSYCASNNGLGLQPLKGKRGSCSSYPPLVITSLVLLSFASSYYRFFFSSYKCLI